tara:strand:+ start:703 stop:876 length:174 start_codon:yes stop_codon:yes gene_type:complete
VGTKRGENQNSLTKTKEKQRLLEKQGVGNKAFLKLFRIAQDGAQFLKKKQKTSVTVC